ncbi:MAG: ATP-dependent DNA helicase RecG, partial [Halieaceae bacterium]
MEGSVNSPVLSLHGVGPALVDKLGRIGIKKVADLLFHLPLRYQDRTRLTPIAAVQPGASVVIEGLVRVADITLGRRRSLVVRLEDGSGLIGLRFFHFSAAQKHSLSPGTRLRCFGEARMGPGGPELFHPEYTRINEDHPAPLDETLTPIYPSTEGVSQLTWRKLCNQALDLLQDNSIADLLPGWQPNLEESLRYLHQPPANASLALIETGHHPAQRRLAFEELVAHNLALQSSRRAQQSLGAPAFASGTDEVERFVSSLPFALTGAQTKVLREIQSDLAQPLPMLRLIQGDVGSGKTVVAACAALQAINSGYQVAIMAPTEILAQQHEHNFRAWFESIGINTGLLSGKLTAAQRRLAHDNLASGAIQLVVGTHALFQDAVSFNRLGLVIVDEQHRFGVHQRLALTQKVHPDYGRPHQLIMTATPIPRTLSMVAYADLDCSVIDELPPGRTPINTVLIDNARRDQVLSRVSDACATGRQAYWVCTLIEESDQLQARAAEVAAAELAIALPDISVGLIHGRLTAAQKSTAMTEFQNGSVQVLVATTVIEVGVDVANASVMIIEN